MQESQCDLHNAIQALQLQTAGEIGLTSTKGKSTSLSGERGDSQHTRDMGLPIFHALGKILYNKRVVPVPHSGCAFTPEIYLISATGFFMCRMLSF